MRNTKEETLDPDDWEATRALAHRMVDEAVEHLALVRERPVWTANGHAGKSRATGRGLS